MKRRNIVWLIPLVILVTFPLWSIPVGTFLTPRNGFDLTMEQQSEKGKDLQTFSMKKPILYQYKNDTTTAVIRAESMKSGNNSKMFFLQKVDSDLYGSDGTRTHIIAQSGTYNTNSEILNLLGSVVVNKVGEDQQLNTNRLIYNGKKDTINCPKDVLITSEDAKIEGGSLIYQIDKRRYDIGGRVYCTFHGFLTP